ncbi:MAG: hypothetical protein ACR2QW_19880 [bacterium]
MTLQSTLIPAYVSIALITCTGVSNASGTGDYGQDSLFQTNVDNLYEEGKSYYYARGEGGKRVDYCIRNGDQLDKVSRRSLKPFQNTSAAELSAHLCDCEQPDQMIDGQLNDRQISAVIYYLNKRYRLSLYSNS